MKNFEPVLLFVKQNEINQQIDNLSTPIDALQTILNTTKNLECKPFTTDEFINLFSETKKTLFEKLTQKSNKKVLGFEVDHEKMFDIIAKPDAVGEIIAQIAALNNNQETQYYSRRVNQFMIIDGILELNTEIVNNINKQFTVFANNDDEMKLFNALKAVETSINELQGLKRIWNINDKIFSQLFDYNKNNDTISLSANFLQAYK